MQNIRPLLALLLLLHITALIFVSIATSMPDWSKSMRADYGIWHVCLRPTVLGHINCIVWRPFDYDNTPHTKDCNGALVATRAFSVLSIIATSVEIIFCLILLIMPTLIGYYTIIAYLWTVMFTTLWLFLGWVMWLGVHVRGHCFFDDYKVPFGSSWYLQLFAWLIEIMVSVPLVLLMYATWLHHEQDYEAAPPMAPGPMATNAPGMTYYSPAGAPLTMIPTAPAFPMTVKAPPVMMYRPSPGPTSMFTQPMPPFPGL